MRVWCDFLYAVRQTQDNGLGRRGGRGCGPGRERGMDAHLRGCRRRPEYPLVRERPRSVDDPRERESAPCGAAAAPEEFEPGELACRTPEGDAEPPRSIRRGTSRDRPSRVSTRLAPSDSLVAAASPSIPPRRGPHRLQCVTRPAKRRSVTLRAGSHDFISSAPGSACHSPNLGTSEPPAADVRRTGARDTAPLPQTYRACARASVRRAPPSPPAIFVA